MVLKAIEDVLLLVGDQVGLENPNAFKVMLRFYLTRQKKVTLRQDPCYGRTKVTSPLGYKF